MSTPFLVGWSFDPLWAIPCIGGAVWGLAYLFGRRFFIGRAPAEKAPLLPDNFLQGVTTERRAAPRRRGHAIEVFLSAGEGEPLLGWVVDRSIGGLCVMVEQPVAQAARGKVRPRIAPESTPWVPVLVKSCRAEGHEYEVGCQFAHTPSWNVLVQFG